ncbi:hypothetical protein EDD16DRAFT_1530655 [Pisolithus croceorrhizus]|nr:hypothetical protein EDD16DRAFT_1530655 [Pisolithus croceorrhizus]
MSLPLRLNRIIVPLGVAVVLIQSSIYDVPGGFRAVMFDRFAGVKDQATGEGTHFLIPWLQKAILYDCRIKPRNISTTTGSKDLQMVSITLRVLSRPDVSHLPRIYQNLGLDYDERVLPSIANEVLKAIVAQFDAAELITQREVRADEFHIKLEDVSITHLTFGKAVEAKQIAQQDAERAKFIRREGDLLWRLVSGMTNCALGRARATSGGDSCRGRGRRPRLRFREHWRRTGDAFLALRKIEASKAIVQSLAN